VIDKNDLYHDTVSISQCIDVYANTCEKLIYLIDEVKFLTYQF